MGGRPVKVGGGRWRSVEFGAVGLVVGAVVVLAPRLHRPPPSLTALAHADTHAEYIKYASGKDSIAAYIAYPERGDLAPAVIVVHEIFGLSDWVRSTTEQLAKDGFIALAPDLLSRRGGTPASPDSARRLIASLNPDTITQDLDAAFAYLQGLKSIRPGSTGVIGFCWGGGESFRYATNNPSLRAFVVCYGSGPKVSDVARIKAAGLGVYADRDSRVNSELYNLAVALQNAHVYFRLKQYNKTTHGFLRTRENQKAADAAWKDIKTFLKGTLDR